MTLKITMELDHLMSSSKMSWSELVSATKNSIICINQKIMQFKQSLEHFALITIKKDAYVLPYCTYMYAKLKIWTFLNLLFCAKNINRLKTANDMMFNMLFLCKLYT